jgi:Alpha amylase, catalytic domain
LRRNPLIYQINTWVWLTDLSERFGRTVTLGSVPPEVFDELAAWQPDAIWTMGVWERSPRGRQIALTHEGLQFEYERALPGFKPEQVVGSPYAIHRYVVDSHLGGNDELAAFRAQLRRHSIGLILDYVPNHVAVDHPWTVEHPEGLVQGTAEDLRTHAASYFTVPENGKIFAHGRDPNWPAWTDTTQVDVFSEVGREQSLAAIMNIASQCDGVRCDMAMLVVNRVFARVWSRDQAPATEFWDKVIPAVKARYRAFIFMAEVYWDMEAELQALGFDYTYDKRLYDRLRHENVHTVRDHLLAASSYQQKMVRFIENHDEARAMSAFEPPEKTRAAATVIAALPGAKLFHDGQFEGRRVRIPVQLGARPHEPVNEALLAFYRKLIAEVRDAPYHDGVYMALGSHPILGGDTGHEHLLAFAWALGEDWRIIVTNYSDQPVKGRTMLPRPAFAGLRTWRFHEVLGAVETVLIVGDDVLTSGLPVTLEPYGAQIFVVTRGD